MRYFLKNMSLEFTSCGEHLKFLGNEELCNRKNL